MQPTTKKKDINEELYKRAYECIAGGQLGNFKQGAGDRPTFIERYDDSGPYYYDYDGNKYYDFCLSYGPSILGGNNDALRKALVDQINQGYTKDFKLVQIEAAEKIKSVVKGIDLLRFTLTGTEANMQVMRVARAYTRKNMIVKFDAHYNGATDPLLGGVVADPANPIAQNAVDANDAYNGFTSTEGRAKHALDDMYILPWNDLGALQNLLERYGDDIAGILMEPWPVNIHGCKPEPGYLESMRELCTRHNVVMIFDEILTGFRLHIGGASEYFGVQPDLWTFSKALGGGFPVSAYGGKREFMDTVSRCEVLASGTFAGYPIGCAAIISVIDQLSANDCEILRRIERLGTMLSDGFKKAAERQNVPLVMQGFPGAIIPVFTQKEKIINNRDAIESADMDAYWYFASRMNKLGIANLQRYCVGADHKEKDIEYAVGVAEEVFAEIADKRHLGH